MQVEDAETGWYRPAGQEVQTLALREENMPLAHVAQAEDPLDADAEPAAQGTHVVPAVAPVKVE